MPNATVGLPAPIMQVSMLPACYIEEDTVGSNEEMIKYSLKPGVNFIDNPQVPEEDRTYYGVKVVDAYTNQFLYISTWRKTEKLFLITNVKSKIEALRNGSGYYKLYLAYANTNKVDEGIVHYNYSSPAIFKLTKKPDLSIEYNNNIIVGKYSNSDKSEREYEYKFEVKDNPNLTTGWRLHEDDIDDMWNLNLGNRFNVIYSVRTINGLEESITEEVGYDGKPEIQTDICKLIAESNKDLGCIDLKISLMPKAVGNNFYYNSPYETNSQNKIYTFTLYKKNQYLGTWYKLKKSDGTNATYELKFINGKTNSFIFHDYSIEHGTSQEYKAVYERVFKDKIYCLNIVTNPYFEDMFLEDETRSVRIHFNPKVSSFKKIIPEAKLETIGNKYPFFFRNGQVEYTEMTISGLISYLMDSEKYSDINYRRKSFETNPISNIFIKTTNLTDENIYYERDYKMELYNWLTNGKPKLFRSPTEGNFVVRLMNVSLTPNDQLGRMLHTFQATAYEIADAKIDPYYPQFYKGGNE